MADKYCDHGAYGAYAATPTWGQAQDGDGTAKTVGTPSTAEIVFTGVPSSGSIAVLGVTLTVSWATSANNCADLLATAINAASGTATGPASFTTKSQVRNHVYARGPANGAPAGTCQIMTRQASAAHAGLIAITHTLNNVSSPGTITFTGGTGGCWGWLFNPDNTIWPSSIALGNYGVWCATPNFTGSQDDGDNIYIRSNKTINRTNTGSLILRYGQTRGSIKNPVTYYIDDGSIWSEDGSKPVLKIIGSHSNNNNQFSIGIANGSFCNFISKNYGDGTYGLKVEGVGTGGGASIPEVALLLDGGVYWEGVWLGNAGTVGMGGYFNTTIGGSNPPAGVRARINDCYVKSTGRAPTDRYYSMFNQNLNYSFRFHITNTIFDATGATSPWTFGVLNCMSSGGPCSTILEGCKFIGFVTGTRLIPISYMDQERKLIAIDNDLGNVRVEGPVLSLDGSVNDSTFSRYLAITNNYGTRDFTIERAGISYIEWNSSKGYPTLNAKLDDGVTPWVIYGVSAPKNIFDRTGGPEFPPLVKVIPPSNVLSEGVRTIECNFLIESTLNWTKSDLVAELVYFTPSGQPFQETTFSYTGEPFDISTENWTSLNYNGQTWLPRKFTFVTSKPVKAGSTVRISVRFAAGSTNITTGVFLDPEILIS